MAGHRYSAAVELQSDEWLQRRGCLQNPQEPATEARLPESHGQAKGFPAAAQAQIDMWSQGGPEHHSRQAQIAASVLLENTGHRSQVENDIMFLLGKRGLENI